MGTEFYPIRTEQGEFRTEQMGFRTEGAELRAGGLWKKLWIAAKNRRVVPIRKLYLIDFSWFRGNSNRGTVD
jgi:hypothetical protein